MGRVCRRNSSYHGGRIKPLTRLTVAAEAGETDFWGTTASEMQSDLTVGANSISGTLKYIDSGTLARDWGAGYFMALKFTSLPASATSVKVGLVPSVSSGLVEIINDPDKNGVFKVSDKQRQQFTVVSSMAGHSLTQTYDLRGLTFEKEE